DRHACVSWIRRLHGGDQRGGGPGWAVQRTDGGRRAGLGPAAACCPTGRQARRRGLPGSGADALWSLGGLAEHLEQAPAPSSAWADLANGTPPPLTARLANGTRRPVEFTGSS